MRIITALVVFALWSTGGAALASAGTEAHGVPAIGDPVPPDPGPFVVPEGLYYVTETYLADVVTHDGPLTTYTTATVNESTGSWARVLETVATGTPSAFDGAAFNGRTILQDGRPVAGTYYENFVLGPEGFVPVSIVFFQDDAELARLASPPLSPGAARIEPSPLMPSLECCVSLPPVETRTETSLEREPRDERAPQEPPLAEQVRLLPQRVEVLRGRPTIIRIRAVAGDRELPVRSWRVVASEAGRAELRSGPATAPFRSAWDRLAPPGEAYELRFELTIASASRVRVAEASLAIVVRSPALTE